MSRVVGVENKLLNQVSCRVKQNILKKYENTVIEVTLVFAVDTYLLQTVDVSKSIKVELHLCMQ